MQSSLQNYFYFSGVSVRHFFNLHTEIVAFKLRLVKIDLLFQWRRVRKFVNFHTEIVAFYAVLLTK